MIILYEVASKKRETGLRLRKWGCLLLSLALFSSLPATAAVSLQDLNDCNWMVTYRGKTYDLAPLTREALARPIETDLRFALQRVPQSAAHLEAMSARQRDAKAHTILASAFVSGLVVSRLLHSREKNVEKKAEIDLISVFTGVFFLGATASSWRATTQAKSELIKAVEAFNENSPHKIQPSSAGSREAELSGPRDWNRPKE